LQKNFIRLKDASPSLELMRIFYDIHIPDGMTHRTTAAIFAVPDFSICWTSSCFAVYPFWLRVHQVDTWSC